MKLYNKDMKDKKYIVSSDRGNSYYVIKGYIDVSEEDVDYFKQRGFNLKEDKVKKGDK